jgi:predicted RNA binding protein YcfA (HicA-like mRNA interferase family)
MASVSGKEFAKAIESRGWVLLRINGSHHIYGKIGERMRLSIPIHGNQALKPGLLKAFLKATAMSLDDFR